MLERPYNHIRFEEWRKWIDYGTANFPILSVGGNLGCKNGSGKLSKYSAYFDDASITMYLYCGFGEGSPAPTPPFTITCWVMKNAHTIANYPIFWSYGLPYLACDGASSPFRLSYRTSVPSQVNVSGTTIPALHTWYHVAAVLCTSSTKIYVNGVLEGTSTTIAGAASGDDFFLGCHNNDTQYRIWGRIDDYRTYKRELSQAEIQEIYNYPNQNNGTRLSLKSNGDVAVSGISEDVEWTLMSKFIGSLDNGITPYDSALNGTAINSAAALSAAGWSTYLTDYDNTGYTRQKGFLQMFYGGAPVGYISKIIPAGYDRVRVVWGNWYSGTATLNINGVNVQTQAANGGFAEYAGPIPSTGSSIVFSESGIVWVSEVWLGKTRTPEFKITNNKLQSIQFIVNKKSPNLHSYDGWATGTGSSGSFSQNGATSENVRIWQTDPFGQPTILWQCVPIVDSGADGGWNHEFVNIDQTKYYRYSVWVMRNAANTGRFYHGVNGNHASGVYARSTGAADTNPYFFHGVSECPTWTWFLVVGHVFPAGSGTGAKHAQSGIYTRLGGLSIQVATLEDFVWISGTTQGRGRNYLYYSTTTTQQQWMCYPRFEVCDGNEVPLKDLISGKAYTNSSKTPNSNVIAMGSAKHRINNDKKLVLNGDLYLI